VTGYAGPLFSTRNVTGSGLDSAAPLDPPTVLEALPTAASPYQLR